jgi:NhaP-type Na+/H+ or K+/H+ antiporter
VLLVTVALSGLAARSVLSTALIFLVAGALVGDGFLGLITVTPEGPLVSTLADLALFTVLFVDGGRLSVRELRSGWRLSGRALGLGMPITLVLVAVAAHYLIGLDWTTALLVGAILAPTDPVFASAIVGRSEVPEQLRRLLNVESGVNDGLALPFVLVFLSLATGTETDFGSIALELVLGIAARRVARHRGARPAGTAPESRGRPWSRFRVRPCPSTQSMCTGSSDSRHVGVLTAGYTEVTRA